MSSPRVGLLEGGRFSPAAESPLFSVIVPTYERRESLEQCLRALSSQDFPRDRFEVIVVDDGSTRVPRDIIAGFEGALDISLHHQANSGPAAARNAGAQLARGAYLVFTDDDCSPDPGWLDALSSAVERHPDRAVGGRVHNALADGVYSSASQQLIEFLYEYYNVSEADGHFFITSNVAFPAARFRDIGGFDMTFPLAAAEDRDLCDRWREHGEQMVYCVDAVVNHAHALGFRGYCRQHFNYGRGAFHLHRARARRGAHRLRVEPANFYTRLVGFPLRRSTDARALSLSALLLMSQVVYVSGYVLERAAFAVRGSAKKSRQSAPASLPPRAPAS